MFAVDGQSGGMPVGPIGGPGNGHCARRQLQTRKKSPAKEAGNITAGKDEVSHTSLTKSEWARVTGITFLSISQPVLQSL